MTKPFIPFSNMIIRIRKIMRTVLVILNVNAMRLALLNQIHVIMMLVSKNIQFIIHN
jgi:hypothetical protein